MNVRKRSGEVVAYDPQRIKIAVQQASREVMTPVAPELAWDVASAVTNELWLSGEITTDIATVQALVVDELKKRNVGVAEAYHAYSMFRELTRTERVLNERLLTDEFISKYKHLPSPMTELGSFVYYRTYSRWLEEEKRREYWWETCRRAVEYNCSLAPVSKEEAELMYDNMFNLRQFLSGRTLWVGGTEVAAKYSTSNFNCFHGDEEFITDNGICAFKDTVGTTVNVLDKNGAWSPALVSEHGRQEIVQLVLRRKGTTAQRIVRTTAGHLWFAKKSLNGSFKTLATTELRPGMQLKTNRRYTKSTLNTCMIGLQHGIVYGDGTYDKRKRHCRISLQGEKQALQKYLTTGNSCTEGNRDSTCIYGLPWYWKELPAFDSNPEYIKGFLLGLLLTDGKKAPTSLGLSQRDEADVRHIRSLFEYIGITTSAVREDKRSNNNLGDYAPCYGFTIHTESIPADWFDYLTFLRKGQDRPWMIEAVVKTGVVEPVYCVMEPKTETFTLSGGLLTHNCAGVVLNEVEAFHDLFYLLLVGSGVGVRVLPTDVAKLPRFRVNVDVDHIPYNPLPKAQRAQLTSVAFTAQGKSAIITVGDSKGGKLIQAQPPLNFVNLYQQGVCAA